MRPYLFAWTGKAASGLSSAQVARGATRGVRCRVGGGKYILEVGGRQEWRAEIVVTSPSPK